jgi:hypothetical protein
VEPNPETAKIGHLYSSCSIIYSTAVSHRCNSYYNRYYSPTLLSIGIIEYFSIPSLFWSPSKSISVLILSALRRGITRFECVDFLMRSVDRKRAQRAVSVYSEESMLIPRILYSGQLQLPIAFMRCIELCLKDYQIFN